MTDHLSNSRYSLAHAQRRINELQAEIIAFAGSNPYTRVIEPDPNGTDNIHKVKLVKPVPVAIPGIVFDAANSLRCALDQAGFTVACKAGTGGRNAKFPFGDNIAEVKSRRKTQARDIPQTVFDVMVALQPYEGGNDLLWAVNKASNTHKHEIVVPIAMLAGATTFHDLRVIGPVVIKPPVWDNVKDEVELLRVAQSGTADYHFEVTFAIAFGKVPAIEGKEVVTCLHAMLSEVERSLMAIEGEARRIGLFC